MRPNGGILCLCPTITAVIGMMVLHSCTHVHIIQPLSCHGNPHIICTWSILLGMCMYTVLNLLAIDRFIRRHKALNTDRGLLSNCQAEDQGGWTQTCEI